MPPSRHTKVQPPRKRYVLAGTGSRGIAMFGRPLVEHFTRYSELVGFFDRNPARMRTANESLGVQLPCYTDYRKMLRELNPDAVIIATRDDTHARYIIETLKAGKRAISEKPLCINAAQARAILAAARKYKSRGGSCWVTHNARYSTDISECKRLIQEGRIGKIKAINFHENLDRRHGADYFRRWHRFKAHSGGLLVHKASHHFDLLNWLVGSLPEKLVAQGDTVFYGKNNPFRGKRCRGCAHAGKCEFYVDFWKNKDTARLYYQEAEKADGYIRDGCVFDRKIDIEDQAGVLYSYRNGVQVSYSLTAFASYEGWHIQFEGTQGRLESKLIKQTNWQRGDVTVQGIETVFGKHLTLFSFKEGVKDIPIPKGVGTHDGADLKIQSDFFNRPWNAKPTEHMAPVEEAVQASLIGHAANISIAQGGKPVKVQELLKKG